MKQAVLSWETDKNGVISGTRVHDARVVAFTLSEDKNFSLKLRREDGSCVLLELRGVREWNLQIWGVGLIVFDISLWKLSDVPKSAWNDLFAARGPGYSSDPKLIDLDKESQLLVKRAPNSYLVSFDTSYGAGSMVIVCDSVQFSEDLN